MEAVVLVANFAIAIGYFFAAFNIVRVMPVRWTTMLSGSMFFLLCASTHVEMNLHYMVDPNGDFGQMFSEWHTWIIHIPQAFAIWFFVIGFYHDLIRLLGEHSHEIGGQNDDPFC